MLNLSADAIEFLDPTFIEFSEELDCFENKILTQHVRYASNPMILENLKTFLGALHGCLGLGIDNLMHLFHSTNPGTPGFSKSYCIVEAYNWRLNLLDNNLLKIQYRIDLLNEIRNIGPESHDQEFTSKIYNIYYDRNEINHSKMWNIYHQCNDGPFKQSLFNKLTSIRPTATYSIANSATNISEMLVRVNTHSSPITEALDLAKPEPNRILSTPGIMDTLDLAKSKASMSEKGKNLVQSRASMPELDLASAKVWIRNNV